MDQQIIESSTDLNDWLSTPAGAYLRDWEIKQFDRVIADIFGYHALQLGTSVIPALQASRIRHCWVSENQLSSGPTPSLLTEDVALPFPDQSLDLVVMPHTLEFSRDPHSCLREVDRVLVPDGRVVVCGFNPLSLWGLRQQRAHVYARFGWQDYFLPSQVDFIASWRLRDWLRLLSFDIEGDVLVRTGPRCNLTNGCSGLLGWKRPVTVGGPFSARCIFWSLSSAYVVCTSSVRAGKKCPVKPL